MSCLAKPLVLDAYLEAKVWSEAITKHNQEQYWKYLRIDYEKN